MFALEREGKRERARGSVLRSSAEAAQVCPAEESIAGITLSPRLFATGSLMGGANKHSRNTFMARRHQSPDVVFTKGRLGNRFEIVRRARAEAGRNRRQRRVVFKDLRDRLEVAFVKRSDCSGIEQRPYF